MINNLHWQRRPTTAQSALSVATARERRSAASVSAMTDDRPQRVPRSKGRSASICATGSSSMEAIPPTADGTPTQRRRRPAARSQSARMTNRRSVRNRNHQGKETKHKKTTIRVNVLFCLVNPGDKSQSNSEPKLTEDSTPDISPNIRRKGSQRRGTSVYQRKSTAFLDVPETKKGTSSHSNTEGEEDEDSYRLRSFSFTSKGSYVYIIYYEESEERVPFREYFFYF